MYDFSYEQEQSFHQAQAAYDAQEPDWSEEEEGDEPEALPLTPEQEEQIRIEIEQFLKFCDDLPF